MKTARIEDLPKCRVRDHESRPWREGYRHIFSIENTEYPHNVLDSDGDTMRFNFCELIPEKVKRPMTYAEMVHWACSADALGWVVKCDAWSKGTYGIPQAQSYVKTASWFRARMTKNGPQDWEPMEVEE